MSFLYIVHFKSHQQMGAYSPRQKTWYSYLKAKKSSKYTIYTYYGNVRAPQPINNRKLQNRQSLLIKKINSYKQEETFSTAAVQHQIVHDHRLDFDSPHILHRSKLHRRRKALESHYIHLHRNTVNYKTDTTYLNPITKGLLSMCCNYSHTRPP